MTAIQFRAWSAPVTSRLIDPQPHFPRRVGRAVLCLIATLACCFAAPAARATTLTWDADGNTAGSTDGSGAWLGSNTWWNGTANVDWASGDDAVFGSGGTAGTVTLSSPTAVQSLTLNGFTGTYTLGSAGQTITLQAGIAINAGAGTTTIVSPITLGAAQTWSNNSASTLTVGTGAITNGGSLLTISGSGNTTVTGVIGGAGGLTKTGRGTLNLNGSAVHSFTGGLTVNAGTVDVSFGNLTANPAVNMLASGNTLTLGGGRLSLSGRNNVPSSQTFASTTLSAGRGSTINLARNGTGSMTVALGGITRNAGSTLNFLATPDTSTLIATTSNTNDASGILGPWATVGSTTGLQYATVDVDGQIVAYTGATPAASDLSNVNSASTNYSFAAGATLAAPVTANTLRYTGAAGTLANGGNTITLNGLMNAGSAGDLIVSGAGDVVIGPARELVVSITNSRNSTISSRIVDNEAGASALTIATAAELTLSGANTYSGGSSISGTGRVNLRTASALGTGPITVNPGASLHVINIASVVGATSNAITLAGGTLSYDKRFTDGWTGPITLGDDSFIDGVPFMGANSPIAGNISGPGGLTKNNASGAGTPSIVMLSGTNTYTGPTVVSAGGLQFKGPASLYNGDTSRWTPANITVDGTGRTLALSVGGAGEFTGSEVVTLISNLTTGVNNNGLKAGSTVLLDIFSAGGTPVTISGNIGDSTGIGGGKINLTIAQKDGGTTNQTVVLSGNNTYTGKTTISRYKTTTVEVSSFNSVATDPVLGTVRAASSSLGAPLTTVDGTIDINGNGDTITGILKYTGTGETTDRVIQATANGSSVTLDQSGSGLLKFVSPFVTTGTATFTLQGSTAGQGEIASAIASAVNTTVTKAGTGTWTLSGANVYTGPTNVNGGVLSVANGTALGATSNGTNVNNGAALHLSGGITVGAESLSLNGTGIGSAGALRNASGANVWQGAVTLAGNARINSDAGSLTFDTASTSITGTNRSLSLGGAGDGTISNAISTGSGSLTKDGVGTWTLGATNSFSGGTTISAGTLVAGSSGALGSGSVSVAAGGTLLTTPGVSVGNTRTLTGGTLGFTSNAARGTVALLTAGAVGAGQVLAPATAWASGTEGATYSDILSLTNTGGIAQVLTMRYDPTGLTQGVIDSLELRWFDPGNSLWVNAIDGNSGGTPNFFSGSWAGYLAATPGATPSTALGVYGRDTLSNTVWAVVNHNSDFAVVAVPEPATGVIIVAAAVAAVVFGRRRVRAD